MTNTPLYRCTDICHKVVNVLARKQFISHLEKHLLCLNEANDWLQQRTTALILEWIEQRVIMNSRLHSPTNYVYDTECNNRKHKHEYQLLGWVINNKWRWWCKWQQTTGGLTAQVDSALWHSIYIHQTNRTNSQNGFSHKSNSITIVKALILLLIYYYYKQSKVWRQCR